MQIAGCTVLSTPLSSLGAHRRAPSVVLSAFDYADVSFSPGLHESQLEQTHKILMGLNEDSLLRPFRMAAGLPAPGTDLNGWYSVPRYLAETFGQWISALSRYYATKGDEPTRLKVERLIGEYAKTLEPTGQIFRANGNPLYFHDKLVLGLQDAAQFCGNEQARTLLSALLDVSQSVLQKKGHENFNFAETYFRAGDLSGDARYFAMAERDLQDGFIEPLTRGENVLAGRHAYSHLNALCGAAQAYLRKDDPKYLQAAVNGLSFIERQSFATGAYGPMEQFLPTPAFDYPPVGEEASHHYSAKETLGESLRQERFHFETGCGSYAHFKLTRYLLRLTQNPHYGDSMERVMYNAALGILPLGKLGNAFYYSNYQKEAKKEYFVEEGHWSEDEWPCCSGTFPQLAADYRLGVYFQDEQGVFVNLYIPSTVRWSKGSTTIALTQAGDYPLSDRILFTVESSKPATFTLRLRIPAWTQQPELYVNGKRFAQPFQPGSFAVVRRTWRSGDRIELVLAKRLELKAVDDRHPDLVALCCGPLVLFAIGQCLPKLDRETLLAARPLAAGSPEWRSGEFRFLPWFAIHDEIYTTYHDVG